jgi:methylenetetrahydrofolate reductase (NADPH)
MTTIQKEINIKELIKGYTIETTPNVYEKFGNLSEYLAHNNDVYITYLPDEDPIRVINTAKKITQEGLNAIPHLPARTITDYNMLEKYIGSLSEKAGCKKILVIGGSSKQIGNINSSLEILQTDLLSKFNFRHVGLAGHPEGHPHLSENDLDEIIIKKNQFASNVDYRMYFVTQFFFEATAFKSWEQHIDKLGNKLEIHAGIPGPATLKILFSYAKSCGIGNSIKFLSKQALNITKITTNNTPDKLIADLAEYKFSSPSSKLTKLHLYPFGGMKKTSQWMNAILENPIKIKNNSGFETIIK